MKWQIFAVLLIALATQIEGKSPPGGPPSRPRPTMGSLPSYTINVPFTISGSAPPSRLCLCFRKTCSVSGMSNSFHRIYNRYPSYGPAGPPGPRAYGYLAYNGVLYQAYRC